MERFHIVLVWHSLKKITTTGSSTNFLSPNSNGQGYNIKDPGLVVSWSLVKKMSETLDLVKLRLARKLQPLLDTTNLFVFYKRMSFDRLNKLQYLQHSSWNKKSKKCIREQIFKVCTYKIRVFTNKVKSQRHFIYFI